jgi:hypothetical protein
MLPGRRPRPAVPYPQVIVPTTAGWTGLPPPAERVIELPPGWTRVAEAPPATWPAPPAHPAGPVVRAERELSGAAKAIVTALGVLVSLLAAFGGLPFIPADAREVFAIVAGAATPVIVYFMPNFRPSRGDRDARP